MKFLKWLFVLLGIAALIAAGVLYYMNWLDLREVRGALRTYNSPDLNIPSQRILYCVLASGIGGLLLGWGLGLPTRTARGIRNNYKDDLESRGVAVDQTRN